MLLVNVEMIILGRQALTDMVLIFFTSLAAFAFWLGFSGEASYRRWLAVFYAAMACATLDKGPRSFLVPLLGIVPLSERDEAVDTVWREGFPLGGTAIFLALAVPYYAAMLLLHGTNYSSKRRRICCRVF